MDIVRLLDRSISFHRCLVDITGSVTGALLLSQAIYWQKRCPREDGWWYKTGIDWEEETGMKRREFEGARRSCKAFLKTKNEGLPCKTWYKLDIEALQTSLDETYKLDGTKQPNWMGRNSQTNQHGTEISSETTTDMRRASLPESDPGKADQDPEAAPPPPPPAAAPPPPAPPPPAPLAPPAPTAPTADAIELLAYLNEKTGRSFRQTEPNMKLIKGRLREPGVDVAGVRQMIDRQVSLWSGGEMEQYLRPETLFNATKFDGYYAQRTLPVKHYEPRNSQPVIDRNVGTCNENRVGSIAELARKVAEQKRAAADRARAERIRLGLPDPYADR